MVGKICPNMKSTPPCTPTFPVQLSTWERLGYMWLLHFLKNVRPFSYSMILQISKLTIGLETKVSS